MANILDYVKDYGHYTLNQKPFGAEDNLVLAQLSYGRYEGGQSQMPCALSELMGSVERGLSRLDGRLFKLAATSARFSGAIAFEYVSTFDPEQEKQFSAITYLLPDGTAYIAYRGTDNTLVGWKEDFNLSFMTPVPAQIEALDYINRIGGMLGCPLRVGGHSKGGNLAVYASAYCKQPIEQRIIEIYNNDGPGHDTNTVNSEGYLRIKSRIRSYIPKSSVIGMLMEHGDDYTVVDSDAHGLFQHNPYTWLMRDGEFIVVEHLSKTSMCINESIRQWLKDMSAEKRKSMFNIVFDVLSASDAKTVRELTSSFSYLTPILAAAGELTPEDRHLLAELGGHFLKLTAREYEQLARAQLQLVKSRTLEFYSRFRDADFRRLKKGGQ